MKKKFKILFSLILCLICILICSNTTTALASTYSSDYTDVFDDLSESNDFDIRNYPSLSEHEVDDSGTQASLEIIQIAESSSNELYLYVYQPLNKSYSFIATSISMSCEYSSNGQNLHPINYDLELVSSYDVFCKYVVKDFVVSDEAYRYYNIVCIRRNYDYVFDDLKFNGTEIDGNEKAISVGQQWCCYYLNDQLTYEMGTFNTLEIEVKYTGNFEFSSGIKWGNVAGLYDSGKSWFICFDLVDYIATHIYDADLSYKIREANKSTGLGLSGKWEYGEWSDDKYITLTDKDEASYDGGGWLSKEYKWNRIMSSDDFIKNAESQKITISDEVKSNIENSQWVFSFCETEKSMITYSGYVHYYDYDIADVTILRIHFLNIDNKIYDLGVVSDRVNPDNKSDGYGGINTDFFEDWFQKIGMLIGIVVLLILLSFCGPIISVILQILISIIKIFFKGIITIISLPFKILGLIFNPKIKKP